MVRIIEKQFVKLAADYLLNSKEGERITDCLQVELDGKMLREMFASENRKEYAGKLLTPIIEKEVSKRKIITLPTDKQMSEGIKDVLEKIADSEENKSA